MGTRTEEGRDFHDRAPFRISSENSEVERELLSTTTTSRSTESESFEAATLSSPFSRLRQRSSVHTMTVIFNEIDLLCSCAGASWDNAYQTRLIHPQ